MSVVSDDDLQPGANFFLAAAGAAAALAGLVFVAVSINLGRIVASKYLADRASETLMLFMGVLILAILGLVPSQGRIALGGEVGTTALILWTAAVRRQLRALRDPALDPMARRWIWLRTLGAQATTLPFIVAGVLLLAGGEHAMAWILAGVIGGFIAGASTRGCCSSRSNADSRRRAVSAPHAARGLPAPAPPAACTALPARCLGR